VSGDIDLRVAQPWPSWIEITEILNRGLKGAGWRCHGVPKGTRDHFWDITEGQIEGSDIQWKVHRPVAMNRPTWTAEERNEKIVTYGGSRQNIDYKRNIYGEHGDASNSVFVLSRLMNCVDPDEGSYYNQDYSCIRLEFERLPQDVDEATRQGAILSFFDIPGTHKNSWSQKSGTKEVGATKGYSAYWAGMDVGVTNHPSEILVYGQRTASQHLDLLLRVHMQRINTDDQKFVIAHLMDWYGSAMKAFALDKTGVGFPIWDQLSRHPTFGDRIHGFNFSEKRARQPHLSIASRQPHLCGRSFARRPSGPISTPDPFAVSSERRLTHETGSLQVVQADKRGGDEVAGRQGAALDVGVQEQRFDRDGLDVERTAQGTERFKLQ
jgi:hypothetical protein